MSHNHLESNCEDHSPGQARGKDVFKCVNGRCQTRISQESLSIIMIMWIIVIIIGDNNNDNGNGNNERRLEVSSVSRGNEETVEHPDSNLGHFLFNAECC